MDTAARTGSAAAAAGAGPDAQAAATAALTEITAHLDGPVTLAVVFLGAAYVDDAEAVRALVADELAPQVLIGVSAQGVVAGPAEMETGSSLSIWAASLPGATCTPLRYSPPAGPAGPTDWPELPDHTHGLVLLADPFTFPTDDFLTSAGTQWPGLPVVGGLASASMRPGGNRLLLDGNVHTDGAVGVALGGDVQLTPLVSQGCRPLGPSYTVTRGDRNVIGELGGQTAMDRVDQIFAGADADDQRRMQDGLHIGLVIDEYADDHEVGNFLVRNVLGGDREQGAIAVGNLISVGQTVRFQLRDADSADQDLRQLLEERGDAPPPDASLLFTCNGRGSPLFGRPDHDAEMVHAALGEAPMAGFFAAGEIGPVGRRSHLHGFTASLLTITAGAPPATE